MSLGLALIGAIKALRDREIAAEQSNAADVDHGVDFSDAGPTPGAEHESPPC
jgi:hypothetical protein